MNQVNISDYARNIDAAKNDIDRLGKAADSGEKLFDQDILLTRLSEFNWLARDSVNKVIGQFDGIGFIGAGSREGDAPLATTTYLTKAGSGIIDFIYTNLKLFNRAVDTEKYAEAKALAFALADTTGVPALQSGLEALAAIYLRKTTPGIVESKEDPISAAAGEPKWVKRVEDKVDAILAKLSPKVVS